MKPHDLTCAACGQAFLKLHSATQGEPPIPRHGDIILCSICGEINTVTLSGLRSLTAQELFTMPEDVRKDLDFAKRNILASIQKQ